MQWLLSYAVAPILVVLVQTGTVTLQLPHLRLYFFHSYLQLQACDMFSLVAERSYQTSLTAAIGNQHQTMWLSGTWRVWTEMFISRTSSYRWKLNYGVKSSTVTGLPNRCLLNLHFSSAVSYFYTFLFTNCLYCGLFRWTLCRCVLWKCPLAQGNLFTTWSTILRVNTSNTIPTLAL